MWGFRRGWTESFDREKNEPDVIAGGRQELESKGGEGEMNEEAAWWVRWDCGWRTYGKRGMGGRGVF
jgi:hypothetical protein